MLMDLTALQYLEVGVIFFLSSIVQGAVGFAAGLFGIPLLLMVGIDLPEAITISMVSSIIQSALGYYQIGHEVEVRDAVRPLVIRIASLPLGAAALWLTTESLDPRQVKQVIGVVLLAIVVFQWAWNVQPRESLASFWEYIAFGLGGFMAGFCGMGGPPMVLWVMAHNWSAIKSRAFLFLMFLVGVPPQSLLLVWFFGWEKIAPALLLGLLGIVVMLLGTMVGLKVGGAMPKWRLRQVIYAMLTLIAVSNILAPLLPWNATEAQQVEAQHSQ